MVEGKFHLRRQDNLFEELKVADNLKLVTINSMNQRALKHVNPGFLGQSFATRPIKKHHFLKA